jgi:hypothetical protein
MIASIFGLLLAIQAPDTTAHSIPADSYADSATAILVAQVRAARERNERLVTSYTATVKQRIGVGIRAVSRDRMLYRQEMVAKIAWKRDAPSTIEIVGAREGVPIAVKGDRIPEDLEETARSLVLDPAEDYLRLIGGERNDDGFVYPLRVGGESDYRFAAGDTTTISLPSGKQIRLVSLRVLPRRSDWRLMAGTLWFDAESHGVVQVVFRPARPFEFRRDVSAEDREDVPGFVNPTAEVKYITLEYGLYENRWWLPRYMAIDASGTMGSWLGIPLRIERVYEDYEVEGGSPPPEGSTFRAAGSISHRLRDTVPVDSAERHRLADSSRAAARECTEQARKLNEGAERAVVRQEIRKCWRGEPDSNLVVVIPSDSAAVLASTALGPPILQMGDLITEDEVRGLAGTLGQLPQTPWDARFDVPVGVGAVLRHTRYNRIEALSLGLGGKLDLGPIALQGTARIGLADLVPNAELSLVRPTTKARFLLTGYYRLAAANPETHPFGPINSFFSLMAQRDDGEYYRTLGTELTAENTGSGWWSARAFFERETAVAVETQASLPHLFDQANTFRPNIVADTATQFGAAFTLRGSMALSRVVTLGGETTLDGATGNFDYGRAAATLRLFVTPAGPLAGALTASAGTSTGTVPTQWRFYLGGSTNLRGYPGGVLAGSAFWSGRAEIGNGFPGFRLMAFTDVGWAGDRTTFWSGQALVGAGIGASVLDGLLRFDLARGLSNPKGWRFEVYVDGVL